MVQSPFIDLLSLIPYWGLWVNVLSRWTGPLGRWAICRGTRWPWRRLTLTNTCTTKPSDVEISAGACEVFKGAASTSTLSTIASAAPKQTPARLWMFILIARLLCFPYSAHIPQMIGDGWGAQSGSIWPFWQCRARLGVRNAGCVSHFALGILKGAELFAICNSPMASARTRDNWIRRLAQFRDQLLNIRSRLFSGRAGKHRDVQQRLSAFEHRQQFWKACGFPRRRWLTWRELQ